jgi:hypothetical protein
VLLSEDLKRRNQLGDLGVDVIIILKRMIGSDVEATILIKLI